MKTQLTHISLLFLLNFCLSLEISAMENPNPEIIVQSGNYIYTQTGRYLICNSMSKEERNAKLVNLLLNWDGEQCADDRWECILTEAMDCIDIGVDVDLEITYKNCQKPILSFCIERGLIGLAIVLIQKGADVNKKDKNNKSPLAYANEAGHVAIKKMLIEKGAKDTSSYCILS